MPASNEQLGLKKIIFIIDELITLFVSLNLV